MVVSRVTIWSRKDAFGPHVGMRGAAAVGGPPVPSASGGISDFRYGMRCARGCMSLAFAFAFAYAGVEGG